MNERTRQSDLDLALIGNCSFSALIDGEAQVVWCCLPRYDSDPVFDSLLDDGSIPKASGVYAVDLLGCERTEQRYRPNTAVLETRLVDATGGACEILDFAPRFKQHGRMYRPLTHVRRIRPVAGSPRIRVRLEPVYECSKRPTLTHGSNHVRYVMPELTLRLTTDASITALLDQSPFVLDRTITLVLGPDETLHGGVSESGRWLLEETVAYWHDWVRSVGTPFEWQEAVIRAAITLKLNAFDDTGAIVAGMTTSIPESPSSGRNWDYRYCWLRDAQFVVSALNRLGTTQTLERYIHYIVNVAANHEGSRLQPVYGINGRSRLEERVMDVLPGYRGMGPVRFGNQAYEQVQNDVYGAVVLGATHMFFDRRLARPGDEALFCRLESLGDLAYENYDVPDAGPWERRSTKRVHTYSSVMCWAACDRLARIATALGLLDRASHWKKRATRIHETIVARAWNEERKSFVGSFEGEDLDAAVLLLPGLGFLRADDPRFVSTVETVERGLRKGDFLFRYDAPDDFGHPETAFLVCTFWYVDALHGIGRKEEARALFERLLSIRNRHGLLSEDIDPTTGELWGNFPQTYSMVGLINSARRLSKNWEEAF